MTCELPTGPGARPDAFCPTCGVPAAADALRCASDGGPLVPDHRGALVAGVYRVGELIGLGGMGATVWSALEEPLGRPVAVKIVPHHAHEAAHRFERGARLMGVMCHPHIPIAHAWGQLPDGSPYLVMERLVGLTLDRLLERGPLDLRRGLHLFDQLLFALEHVHDHGVVHRDVKPSNLFIVTRGGGALLKIVDFGLARRIAPSLPGASDAPPEAPLTRHDRICGTPEYMAPEQILAAPIDARADLYGAGATLFRLLTGELPFTAPARRALYAAKTRATAPSLAEAAGRPFPAALEALVARALARAPDDRFPTAHAMRLAAARVCDGDACAA